MYAKKKQVGKTWQIIVADGVENTGYEYAFKGSTHVYIQFFKSINPERFYTDGIFIPFDLDNAFQ